VLIISTAPYTVFMSLWEDLPPGLQQKATSTIQHTLTAEIQSRTAADESIPPMDPAPSRLLDPDLLAAFLAEPVPPRVNLGPSAIPQRRIVGGVSGSINDESAGGRASKRGNDTDKEDAGWENSDVDEDDAARDSPEDGDNGGDDGGDDGGDESDINNMLSEGDVSDGDGQMHAIEFF
jgi:hypothetical protein